MSTSGWIQLLFIAAVTAVAAPLLGRYLAATFRGGRAPGDRVFLPVERLVYRGLRIDPDSSWTWRAYALAVLTFGLFSTLLLYLILRLQGDHRAVPLLSQWCSTRASVSPTRQEGAALELRRRRSLERVHGVLIAEYHIPARPG